MVDCKIWIGQNPTLWKKVQEYFFENDIYWANDPDSKTKNKILQQKKTMNFIIISNNCMYYGDGQGTNIKAFNQSSKIQMFIEDLGIEITNINNYSIF